MDGFMRALVSVWTDSGFAALTWQNMVMILVGLVLLYLAIAKDYEPLLLMPIAFGDIMANFPNTGFETDMGVMMAIGFGIKYEIFPPLIFMGVGSAPVRQNRSSRRHRCTSGSGRCHFRPGRPTGSGRCRPAGRCSWRVLPPVRHGPGG